jgi:hypothetical protein
MTTFSYNKGGLLTVTPFFKLFERLKKVVKSFSDSESYSANADILFLL